MIFSPDKILTAAISLPIMIVSVAFNQDIANSKGTHTGISE